MDFEDGVFDDAKRKEGVHKSWIFTLNNYTEKDEKFFNDLTLTYSVVGKEIGGTTGTPHLQGFITFARAYRFASLKKLHPRASWAYAKATDAGNYCLKDQDYTIRDYRSQGKRNDLLDYVNEIKQSGMKRACELNPVCALKFPNGTKFIHSMMLQHRRVEEPPSVFWWYGDAGVGKTRTVFDRFGQDNIYVKNCSKGNKWFDGYEQQSVCLFDDFRADTLDWNFILQLTDRYPLSVEVKNAMIPFNSPVIIFTSPRSPEATFLNNGEDINQFLRRVTEVKNFVTEVNV